MSYERERLVSLGELSGQSQLPFMDILSLDMSIYDNKYI